MGITGYYQKFIEGFSNIDHPITSLQKKGTKCIWSKKLQESFEKLRHLLTTTPILKITDPYKDFNVCMDACIEGLGGVLMQDTHVIYYESRKLKEHKRKHVTHDLELATIIHTLNMWWQYLIGRKFVLMSYNIALKYIFDKQNLKAR